VIGCLLSAFGGSNGTKMIDFVQACESSHTMYVKLIKFKCTANKNKIKSWINTTYTLILKSL
jgi:hypothetical protein